MKDCIFCKIINNDIPSYTIYEDDLVKVFMDINPSNNGHLLMIPKKHVVTVNDIDDELMTHMLKIEKEMYKLLKDKLHCDGLTISQNNDYGQEVKHYHIHMIPRFENDLIEYRYDKNKLKDVEEIFKLITK